MVKMDEAEKFRDMITKKDFPGIKNIYNNDFGFQTVFYKYGPSYCYCRCAFDHEYFSYISDNGEVDMEKVDKLAKAVENGQCQHTVKVTEECYLRETRVKGIHIASALGFKWLTEPFVNGLYERNKQITNITTSVFKVTPLDLSVLKNNEKTSNLLREGYISKCPDGPRPPSWGDIVLYASEHENDVLYIENVLYLEILIKRWGIPSPRILYEILTVFPEYSTFSRCRVFELLFKNNLTYMFLSLFAEVTTTDGFKRPILTDKNGYSYYMLENVFLIAELAVIYNHRDIFEKSLHLCNSATRDDLLEVCCAFQRQNFQRVLLEHDDLSRKPPPSDASKFECLYQLLKKYKLSGDRIQKAMSQIPDVLRMINSPFDTAGNDIRVYPELSPLQSYVFDNLIVRLSVVRPLIDLGADIDVVFPSGLKPFFFPLLDQDVLVMDPHGQTLLMYIVNNEGAFEMGFRELLELLLYENVSLAMNDSVIASGINRYICRRIFHGILPFKVNSVIADRSTHLDVHGAACVYDMDTTLHESALEYTIPLLIEAGFKYNASDIGKFLKMFEEYSEKRGKASKVIDENGMPFHLLESLQAFFEKCLSGPRSLKLQCRDVLRNTFPRRQIHKYVNVMELPKAIQDFLLLKLLLRRLPHDA